MRRDGEETGPKQSPQARAHPVRRALDPSVGGRHRAAEFVGDRLHARNQTAGL